MFDDVPTRLWLLILIGLIAFTPARYVYHHIMASPTRQDITRPQKNLNWRTPRQLAFNVTALCALAALAIYIFTPAAEEFAKSPSFWPVLMTGMTAFFVYWTVDGLATGKMEPFTKGGFGPYSRHEQPKRYWASLAWNLFFTGACIWMVINMWTNPGWSW